MKENRTVLFVRPIEFFQKTIIFRRFTIFKKYKLFLSLIKHYSMRAGEGVEYSSNIFDLGSR
jgi:hypothetical protein